MAKLRRGRGIVPGSFYRLRMGKEGVGGRKRGAAMSNVPI